MRLLWWCIITTLVTTYSNAAVDVERTVTQVQSILQQNSHLPRLSRDEIIQLLNDIRAEDAKSKSSSQSQETDSSKQSQEKEAENETVATNKPDFEENEVSDVKSDVYTGNLLPKEKITETTTKRNEPTLMVVLPYTPRDGSSLQELYTRPPRVEMVPVTESILPDNKKEQKLPKKYTKSSENNIGHKTKHHSSIVYPAGLQEFLDTHGLKQQPGQLDHFLLPLEGFKPLPSVKAVDGSVELPENILLTYDLISPSDDIKSQGNAAAAFSTNNFLYDPIRPDLPFELETSSSETKKTVIPLEVPKSRITKAIETPNLEPIDYDSIKVIPLPNGPNPVGDQSERAELDNELRKRQANSTDQSLKISLSLSTSTNSSSSSDVSTTESSRSASSTTSTEAPTDSSVAADTDPGASITDLEESFGGLAPSQPGDSQLPPPKKNGFYWMLDWNSFLEVGDGDTKVNIRFEPKLGDPQMFLPVNVP